MGMGVSHKISVGMMLAVGAVLALRAQEPPAGRGGGAGRGGRASCYASARSSADIALARRRSGRARSRPRALGEPLHRVPRLPGARFGYRSEHHPHEDRQLRSLARLRPGVSSDRSSRPGTRRRARNRARRSPTRRWWTWRTSCGSGSTIRCAARPCSRPVTSSSGTPKLARRTSTARAGARPVTTPPPGTSPASATRIPEPVDLQQRMLFPGGGGRGRGARGAAPAAAAARATRTAAPTMTITPPSGPSITGVPIEESDFYVTLRDADGTLHVVRRTPAPEDHPKQSAAGAHRPARSRQRHADPRSGRLSGDTEMRALITLGAALLVTAVVAGDQAAAPRAAAAGPSGLTTAQIEKPTTDAWATYNGDYSGRRFSKLNKITAENVKHLSLAWIYDLPARRHDQGDAAADWRRAVLHDAEPCLCRRRPHRAGSVALHVRAQPRRHPDRQSRRRHPRRHRVLRHDRLQSRGARHQDRARRSGPRSSVRWR